MPIEIKYLDKGRGTLFAGKGVLTAKEVIEANNEIYSDEEKIRKYIYGLCDYLKVEDFKASNEELEFIAKQDEHAININPNIVDAIVAREDIVFGLCRVWEAYLGDVTHKTNVFRSRDQAELWIKEKIKSKEGIEIAFE